MLHRAEVITGAVAMAPYGTSNDLGKAKGPVGMTY
jgi:hypothetical protein